MNYVSMAPLVCLGLCAASGVARAGGSLSAYVVDQSDVLYSLDLTSGATSMIGQIDEPYIYDLMLSDSGRLFAQHDASPGFIEIDTGTGLVSGGASPDSFFDGDFLGEQLIGGWQSNIFNVNTSTGVTSDYLVVTYPGTFDRFSSMTIVDAGLAYAIVGDGFGQSPDLLVSLDFMTGVMTEIDSITHGRRIAGMEFVDGRLIALDRDGLIFDVSVDDGSFSQIADVGFAVDAFAAVPSPGTLGLLAFAGVLSSQRRRD